MLIRLAILLLTICSYSHSSPYSWTQMSGTEQTTVQYIEDNPEVEIIWGYENGLWFQYSVVEMNESIKNTHPTLEFLSPDKNYWIRTHGDTPATTKTKPDSVIIPELNWNPEKYFKGKWEVRKIFSDVGESGVNTILVQSLNDIQNTSTSKLNELFKHYTIIKNITPVSNKILKLTIQDHRYIKELKYIQDGKLTISDTIHFRERYEALVNSPKYEILSENETYRTTDKPIRFFNIVERSRNHMILQVLGSYQLISLIRKS